MVEPDDCIIVVDDEMLILIGLRMALTQLGYTVCGIAMTTAQAVDQVTKFLPKLVLLDFRLRDGTDGIETARLIREVHTCHIVFITGSNEPETRRRIEEIEPDGLLIKPIMPQDLKAVIESLAQS